MSRRMASTDWGDLIAETERLMNGGGGASSAAAAAAEVTTTTTTTRETVRSPGRVQHSTTTAQTSSINTAGGGSLGGGSLAPPVLALASASPSTAGSSAQSYAEHKSRVASAAHTAALRALSPRRALPSATLSPRPRSSAASFASSAAQALSPTRLFTHPAPAHPAQPLSPSRLFTRPGYGPSTLGASSSSIATHHHTTTHARPMSSPLSPREQARREMTRTGMKSPRLASASPGRVEFAQSSASTFGAGASMASFRASSASPTRFRPASPPSRFRAVVDATRVAAAELDSTLRLESLTTPAPVRARSRQSSPAPSSIRASPSPVHSPTRYNSVRPSPLDASHLRATTAPSYVYAPLEPWRELNRQLSLNGYAMVPPFPVPADTTQQPPWSPNSDRFFRGIPAQAPSVALNTLLANFTSLLADHARRGQTIQELTNRNASEDINMAHLNTEIVSLRRTNQNLTNQVEDLSKSLEHSSIDRAESLRTLTSQIEQSASQYNAVDLKYHQSLRETQQRLEEVHDLRRQLDEQQVRYQRQMDLENERTQMVLREKELDIAAAQQRTRDLEHQLQESQLVLLTTQAAKRDSEEEAFKREQHAVHMANLRTAEHDEKLHSLAIAHEADRAAARQRLRDAESEWSATNRAVGDQLSFANAQNGELSSLNAMLHADVAALQTKGHMQDDQVSNLAHDKFLQSELAATLERKVAGLQDQVDLVCDKLKVHDPDQIGGALDQLVSVASAVPGMQDFLVQIWGVVSGSSDGAHSLTPENLISLTTSVIPTLKSWQYASVHAEELQRFRLDVLDALRRRVHRSPLNPLHSASGAASSASSSIKLHDELAHDEIVFELNDVVANENRLNALVYDQHASPSSFFALWAQMDKAPLVTQPHSQDPERIIAHIQQLFDVPHRIGLFPKMNELFLFVSETRPAIQAMRSLLRLDSRATIHTCIKALRRAVENGGIGGGNMSMGASLNASRSFAHSPERSVRHESNGRGLAWTVTSPSKHESSFLQPASSSFMGGGNGGSSAPSHDQMQRNATYWAICKQVKATLGVKKMSDIVGAVAGLTARASQPPPQADFLSGSILAQLVSMLEVKDLTQLPSAVTRLRDQNGDLRRQVQADERTNGAGRVAQELSHQLAAKRDEFIENLKQIVGVAGQSDPELVNALTRLVNNASSGANIVPQMTAHQKEQQLVISQLRGYLDVASIGDIVSTVRTLIKKIHSYDEIYPQLDSIVSRLYDLLSVSTLDDIVPAVRRLATRDSNASRLNLGQGSAGLGPAASVASSVRGVTGSVETSPTLSAISACSSQLGRYQGSSAATTASAASASIASAPVTTRTSTVSHTTSSLYVSGKSPYRATMGAGATGSSSSSAATPGRVTFESERHSDDPLSSYAPASSARHQRETDAEHQREIDEQIDRTLGQSQGYSRR